MLMYACVCRLGVVWRTKDPREAAAARGETVGLLEELGFIYLGIAPEGGTYRQTQGI